LDKLDSCLLGLFTNVVFDAEDFVLLDESEAQVFERFAFSLILTFIAAVEKSLLDDGQGQQAELIVSHDDVLRGFARLHCFANLSTGRFVFEDRQVSSVKILAPLRICPLRSSSGLMPSSRLPVFLVEERIEGFLLSSSLIMSPF